MAGGFRRQLRQLDRRHRGTTEQVEQLLNAIRAKGIPERALRIPRVKGAPVYKLRIQLGESGTRQGRLIFFYEEGRVVPLFIYAKSDRENVLPPEIIDALRAAELLPGQM